MEIERGIYITRTAVDNACHRSEAPPELLKRKLADLIDAGIVVSVEDTHALQVFHGPRRFERWFDAKMAELADGRLEAGPRDRSRPEVIIGIEIIRAAHELTRAHTEVFKANVGALIEVGFLVAIDGGNHWQQFDTCDEFLEWFALMAPKPPEFFGLWGKYQTPASIRKVLKDRRSQPR